MLQLFMELSHLALHTLILPSSESLPKQTLSGLVPFYKTANIVRGRNQTATTECKRDSGVKEADVSLQKNNRK